MPPVASFFVSCTPGLEPALAQELSELGFAGQRVTGGVELDAPEPSCAPLNRWSRVASRVLMRLGEVTRPAELRDLSLASVRAAGSAVRVEVSGGDMRAWLAGAERAWGRLAAKHEDAVAVSLRVHGGRCTVSVDTSGELLHLRGYRQEVGRAPLRETLAAGVLRLAGFDPARPLWDVMCGSGTLVIEAAEWSLGLAPGRNRAFAFEHFPSWRADGAASPRSPRAESRGPSPIIGSDLNAGALGTARRNARRAGVLEALTLERLDATKLQPRELEPGLVVANLPYGKRVGAKTELGALYRGLGASLQRACAGWSFGLLLEEGQEVLGLPVRDVFEVSNGGIRCQLVVGTVGRG